MVTNEQQAQNYIKNTVENQMTASRSCFDLHLIITATDL